MTTPKPNRGSVGPGTLDQELQEHKGLLQNRIASKGPSDFQGNQKAKVAAAKGLLPHRDHKGPRAAGAKGGSCCRSHKGLLTEGPRAAGATGAPTTTRHQQETSRGPGNQRQQPRATTNQVGPGPQDPMPEDTAGQVPGLCTSRYVTCSVILRPGRSSFQTRTVQT